MPSASDSTRALTLLTVTLFALPARTAGAQDLPEGFVEEPVFTGLVNPTSVRFHPDGRVFVSEKGGRVLVFDGTDDPTPTTFVDINNRVHDFWDRGLLSIALHPDFEDNPYVYLLYTLDARPGENPPSWGDQCPDPPGATGDGCVVQGRLSRFRAAGDQAMGAEEILIQDWCQQFPSHSIGALAFGPDGALYVTGGDGASFNFTDFGQTGSPRNPCGDPPIAVGAMQMAPSAEGGALRSQDLRSSSDPVGLDGTLLRLDPDTGEGLPNNPLYGGGTDTDDGIIAYGLRNPFRIAIRPGTQEIWIADVGWDAWEEIDIVANPTDAVIENFGWPCYEGNNRQPGYDQANLTLCESLYAAAGAHTQPYYTYHHANSVVSGDGCSTGSSSVTGLAFYDAGNFPDDYENSLIFADYARNCIWAMLPDANGRPDPSRRRVLNRGAPGPVDLTVGPDGYVYYVALRGDDVRRIRYLNGEPLAVVTATPTSGATPLLVQFDATGSSDPNGDPLTFAWEFDGDNDFNDASSAMPTHTFTTGGSHTVRVRVSDPGGRFDIASIVIEADNNPPVATIDMPLSTLLFRVGDIVNFSGHATDPEQGNLPGTSLSWEIVVQHCSSPTVCHEHVVNGVSGVASGNFAAPDHDYPSYLELRLIATDANGLTDTATVAIQPATATFQITSTPPGINVAVGSAAQAAPFTVTGAIGSAHTLSAPPSQVISNMTYEFVSWSNGGAATHLFTLPLGHSVLNATYALSCGNGQLQSGEQCDDGNRTAGDCCSAVCTFEAQGSACGDDGERCTLDVCDAAGVCTHADSGDCAPLGAECDEGEDCESDYCADGVCCATECGGGAPDDCQACSVESGAATDGECSTLAAATRCRAAEGACDVEELCDGASTACPEDAKVDDGADCDNGRACDGTDECQSGQCVPEVAPDCDDGNACTADSCLDEGGCAATPIEGCCLEDSDCDDGDECTEDACPEAGGSCTHDAIEECCEGDDCEPVTPDAGKDAGPDAAVGDRDSGGPQPDDASTRHDAGHSDAGDAGDGGDAGTGGDDDDGCNCSVPGAQPAPGRGAWLLTALLLGAVLRRRRRT